MAYEQVKVKTPLILRLLPILSIVLFFGTWQIVVEREIVPSTMMASPIQIFQLFLAIFWPCLWEFRWVWPWAGS